MTSTRGYETLVHRDGNTPILTAANCPYPAHIVFNAGATRLHDGTTRADVQFDNPPGSGTCGGFCPNAPGQPRSQGTRPQ